MVDEAGGATPDVKRQQGPGFEGEGSTGVIREEEESVSYLCRERRGLGSGNREEGNPLYLYRGRR